ncbi:MAG: SDR family NAD(P)-dependent oxidoreductase [Sphingorhabdus sp.]
MVGRAAIIIGAAGAIGCALADTLEDRQTFDLVHRLGRSTEPAMDLTDEASIARTAGTFATMAIKPELIIVATGLLHRDGKGPEKGLKDIDPAWTLLNYQVNALGPALVAKHFLPLMPKDRLIRFAALSARVGSISDNELGGWYSYRASKAGLNMMIRNIAIEWKRKNPQSVIVGLHPGTVVSPLSAPFKGNPAHERSPPDKSATRLLDVLEKLEPSQSGGLFAYDGQHIAP